MCLGKIQARDTRAFMNSEVYWLFDQACPVIVVWLSGFVGLTLGLLAWRWKTGQVQRHRESLIGGELPGILLVLMHSVCFVYSLYLGDWWSVVVFGWWGPGFLVVAILVLMKRPVAWQRIARATSISCKLNYLILVGLFWYHDAWGPIFAYSLWIMHDQVRLAWLQQNADRTRRVSEDYWLPRVCYPLFLSIPLFTPDFPLRWLCVCVAGIIFILWMWGILRLIQRGLFFQRPASFTDNLRDIIYLDQRVSDSQK